MTAPAPALADLARPHEPRVERMVLAIASVNGATAACARHGDAAALAALRDALAILAAAVAEGGGEVVKALGDGALLAFPVERAHHAVELLGEARERVEARWRRLDDACRAQLRLGVGTVLRARLLPDDPRDDLYGDALNRLFRLPPGELACTPEMERLLAGDGR